jgi:hypothetical protein
MLGKSVIRGSGQLWKFVLAAGALLVGSFAPLLPASGIDWTAGSAIAIVGYVYGIIAIRCSRCKSMWLWEAAKDTRLYQRLFGDSSCPACGHKFDIR